MDIISLMEPERVDVLAYFGHGVIKPIRLLVKNRPVTIKKIVLTTKRREGSCEILTFSLQSETSLYVVDFNKQTCQWRLLSFMLI